MTNIESVIADLETAKMVLCTPGIGNSPMMLIKIGQAIAGGIQLLQEYKKTKMPEPPKEGENK